MLPLFALLLSASFTGRAETYSEWRASVFTPAQAADPLLSAEDRDPDGDGIVNLLEYAFDLDPNASQTDGLPAVSTAGDYLGLTFRQRKTSTDLIYLFQTSDNLLDWATINQPAEVNRADHGAVIVRTLRDTVPRPAARRRFLRITVQRVASSATPSLAAPSSLRATLQLPLRVELRWTDGNQTETGYVVERQDGSGSFDAIATLGPNATRYLDTGVVGSTTYHYRVRAIADAATTEPSNTVTISTPLDTDNDGLPDDLESEVYHTDPFNPDTDGDGLPDGVEALTAGLDPLSANDKNGDLDGDGVSNADEVRFNTDLGLADSDGDGVPDGVEIEQGSNPNDASDEGAAPDPRDLVTLYFNIQEMRQPYTQNYRLTCGPTTLTSKGILGDTQNVKIRRGVRYPITIQRLRGAGVDYAAYVIDFIHQYVLIDDPDHILGEHPNGSPAFDGKKAYLTIPKLKLITPSGDPVREPNDTSGSDGQNEFVFDDHSPGVLQMYFKTLVLPVNYGIAARVKQDVRFYG